MMTSWMLLCSKFHIQRTKTSLQIRQSQTKMIMNKYIVCLVILIKDNYTHTKKGSSVQLKKKENTGKMHDCPLQKLQKIKFHVKRVFKKRV